MIGQLDDYSWREVFAFAGEAETPDGVDQDGLPVYYNNGVDLGEVPPGADVGGKHFGRNDIAELVWIEEGENDERNWLVGGELQDGRWFFITAGCDYTGWDCRSWGKAYVAVSREAIERFGMSDEDRRRLGVEIEGQTNEFNPGWE